MKTFATILAGAALALTGATAASAETRAEKSEAKLARMLEGRVAGEPVSCINTMSRSSDVRVLEYVGLVYDTGDTIYVARPSNPNDLRSSDIVIVDRFSSRLCNTDVVRTVDQTGNFTGVVMLGDFVPYRKG